MSKERRAVIALYELLTYLLTDIAWKMAVKSFCACMHELEDAGQCAGATSAWHLHVAGESFVRWEDAGVGRRWRQWTIQENITTAHETDWGIFSLHTYLVT